ncbi:hypothetical protein ABEF91_003824 [Exophiala dermatitidis]
MAISIDEALASDVPLPVSILSDLGKGPLQKFFRNGDRTSDPPQLFALWRKLVLTATSPEVVHNHITAVCNALCVYLNAAALSPVPEIRQFVLSEETWFDALQCCHKAFDDGKTKPAFQLLEGLCGLLDAFEAETVARMMVKAAFPLVRWIILASPRSDLKKACLMLVCLVRKTPILIHLEPIVAKCTESHHSAWMRRLARYTISPEHVLLLNGGGFTDLFLALIFAMTELDTRNSAIKLCSALCSSESHDGQRSTLQSLAQRVVEVYLDSNHAALGDFAENVLPAIFNTKQKLMSFIESYTKSSLGSEARMAVFLAALKVGRVQNILSEKGVFRAFAPSECTQSVGDGDDYSAFRHAMITSSAEIRILAYNLLTSSPPGNTVVSEGALECILSSIKYLHDDADAHERGEILSITRRLLRRIQLSFSALRKANGSQTKVEAAATTEAQYKSFHRRFYRFLKTELQTGVPYSRHSLSLHSLRYLSETSIIPDILKDDRELISSLCCLAIDPFDDVRNTASRLLQFLSTNNPNLVDDILNAEFLSRLGLMAAKTVRADHADGMGRLLALSGSTRCFNVAACDEEGATADTCLSVPLSMLERLIAETKDFKPGSKHPIHAYMLAIHYRLRDLKARDSALPDADVLRIYRICASIWDHVRSQLCVDSPETSSELEDEDTDGGPKDLLAYSWRALRDSSLVVQSLILAGQPRKSLFSMLGDLCMDQLISLRHRGAFSTVAQTFSICCERVWACPDVDTRSLIEAWKIVALQQIEEQSDRLTRRSAGLPAMILALLSPTERKFFSTTVTDLMEIAQRPIHDKPSSYAGSMKLPQVHALNCLKEIMTSSRFSAVVVQYLGRILQLAANCLSSGIWAIRNCGLMLLRASINRLDSTNTVESSLSRMSSQDRSLVQSPSVIAVSLLESAKEATNEPLHGQDTATEHVFAALDLLGHLHAEEVNIEDTNRAILRELAHSTWAVRDHAAFLLATRLSGLPPPIAIQNLFQDIISIKHENEAHGVLLCCRYILTMAMGTISEVEFRSVLEIFCSGELVKGLSGRSPYVRSAYLDLLNAAAAHILDKNWAAESLEKAPSPEIFQSMAECSSIHWPFLQRRILLYKTYLHLLRDTTPSISSELGSAVMTELIAAPDALHYALNVLQEKHCLEPPISMVIFLVDLIHRGYKRISSQEHVLQQAFSCLAHSLRHLTDIPTTDFQHIDGTIGLGELSSTRELGNVAMELEAFLLGGLLSSHQDVESVSSRTEQWLLRVEFAAADYLDFPTRLSAARAVSSFSGFTGCADVSGMPHGIGLRLLLILYDLLNDDDEEVRFEAVEATRKLELHRVRTTGELGFCALAARELLLREVSERYLETKELGRSALLKLMKVGQEGDSSYSINSTGMPFHTSVASNLKAIIKAKGDLFAEERQNLYIDDLREIEVWSKILHNNHLRFLNAEQIDLAVGWTTDGLNQLLHLLQTEQRSRIPASTGYQQSVEEVENFSALFNPLGATYDHEILVVFLKVVCIARILLAEDETKPRFPAVRELLQQSRADLVNAQANEVLLDAVNVALAEQP